MRNRLKAGFIADGDRNLLRALEISILGVRHAARGLTHNVQAVFVIGALFLLMSSAWGQTAPNISSISPTVGPPSPVGSSVTLHGANFGSAQGTSTVTFGGILATPSSWSDTAIVVPVPSSLAAGNADIAVAINGSSSNTQTFVVIPVITGVSPGSAPIGASVTINGAGFGTITNTVTFNGTTAAPSSWTANSVTVPVPTGATTGNLIVTVNSIATNQVSFTVLPPQPTITSISPTVGPPSPVGSSLTIRGTNFGSTRGASSVTIGGITGNPSSWSNSTIVVPVPSSLPAGSADVVVRITGGTSNAKAFFAIPVITGISPNPAPIGAPVTISGAGFGTVASSLTFNGTDGTPSSWSSTSIVAPVPTGATTGSVVATINGFSTNGATLTVSAPPPPPPSITSVSPTSGSAGTIVSISGSHFGNTQGTSLVRIGGGGGTADVSTWSDTAITVTVPNTATSGPLLVIVNNQASNGVDFTAPPVIGSLSPLSGMAGTLMTINGTNFGGAQGSSTISIAGIPAAASAWAATSIQVPIPSGAATGEVLVTVNSVLSNSSTFVLNPTNGIVTSFRYDAKGQLISSTDPLNRTSTLTYTPLGGTAPAGLVQTSTDALNHMTQFQYDAAGNQTRGIDAAQNSTSYAYDAMNRVVTVTFADMSTNQFAYDMRGRKVSFSDGNQNITAYAYDDAGRLITVTDANNGMTRYSYDNENNLTAITDALQRQTTFDYDDQGRLQQMTFPSGLTESYTYDAIGNVLAKTDRKQQTIHYFYDALDRLVSKQYPDGTTVSFAYDLANRMISASDNTGTYGFSFDRLGRLTASATQYAFLPGSTFTNTYGYDVTSNRISFSAPDGSTNTYVRDALNRLSTLSNSLVGQFSFAYDALSRRTTLNRPNGVTTIYNYDSLSRRLGALHKAGALTLDGASYTYDNVGNRTSTINSLNNIIDHYSYDSLYQLTQVAQGAVTTESYSYDSVGNRLSSSGISPYTYNSSNELTSTPGVTFTYDGNGNTRTKTDSTGTTTYTWDFDDRLASVSLSGSRGTVAFKYDPFGRRIQKSSSGGNKIYLYDGSNIVEEIDQTGTVLASYTQGEQIDEPLAQMRNATVGYYELDGLGSVTSISNSSGALANSYVYGAFGQTTTVAGVFDNPFQYTGRELDLETNMYFYRSRYYDPSTGHFLSEDSMAWAAGGTNFYAYAKNDPVKYSDPTGHEVAVVGSRSDIVDYVTARNYLIKDSMMADVIHTLELSPDTFLIKILRGADCNNRYDSDDRIIYWNPHCGLWCSTGGGQSPAMGLGHEMAHGANPHPNTWWDLTPYDTREEHRVIEGAENHAAKTLGEGIRHDHRGTSVPHMATPTTKPTGPPFNPNIT
jgi:RHS repeat-associated protein